MAKIFVSYARADSRKVKRVLKELEAHGLEFWIDTSNIGNGDKWTEEISKAIKNCSRFLLFMSTNSMSSDNVEREIYIAYKNKKKISILRLDEAKPPPSVEYELAKLNWTNYSSHSWETEIVSALGGGRQYFQTPKTTKEVQRLGSSTNSPFPKKAPKTSQVIQELERIFSTPGPHYKDQCDAAIAKLDVLRIIVGSHWLNAAYDFKEMVPRIYLVEKLELIKSLIQSFQETCPPGLPARKQAVQTELKALKQELTP